MILCVALLTACSTKNEKVSADNSFKKVQLTLPFVSNDGLCGVVYTPEEIEYLFSQLEIEGSPSWFKNFSMENVSFEMSSGSYEFKNGNYEFKFEGENVENFNINSQELGLYFHEINLIYDNADIKYNTLAVGNVEGVLVNAYTGEIEKHLINHPSDSSEGREKVAGVVGQILYDMYKEELEKDFIIDELISVGSSNNSLEIAKEGLEYIAKNYEYDVSKSSANAYISLQEFIEDKRGICNQFARLYKLYLDYNNIENRLVYGNFHGKENLTNHVWNEVKINGKWISVDTTGNKFGDEGNYSNYVVTHYASY